MFLRNRKFCKNLQNKQTRRKTFPNSPLRNYTTSSISRKLSQITRYLNVKCRKRRKSVENKINELSFILKSQHIEPKTRREIKTLLNKMQKIINAPFDMKSSNINSQNSFQKNSKNGPDLKHEIQCNEVLMETEELTPLNLDSVNITNINVKQKMITKSMETNATYNRIQEEINENKFSTLVHKCNNEIKHHSEPLVQINDFENMPLKKVVKKEEKVNIIKEEVKYKCGENTICQHVSQPLCCNDYTNNKFIRKGRKRKINISQESKIENLQKVFKNSEKTISQLEANKKLEEAAKDSKYLFDSNSNEAELIPCVKEVFLNLKEFYETECEAFINKHISNMNKSPIFECNNNTEIKIDNDANINKLLSNIDLNEIKKITLEDDYFVNADNIDLDFTDMEEIHDYIHNYENDRILKENKSLLGMEKTSSSISTTKKISIKKYTVEDNYFININNIDSGLEIFSNWENENFLEKSEGLLVAETIASSNKQIPKDKTKGIEFDHLQQMFEERDTIEKTRIWLDSIPYIINDGLSEDDNLYEINSIGSFLNYFGHKNSCSKHSSVTNQTFNSETMSPKISKNDMHHDVELIQENSIENDTNETSSQIHYLQQISQNNIAEENTLLEDDTESEIPPSRSPCKHRKYGIFSQNHNPKI